MNVTPTKIPDVLLLEPDVFADERGFLMETWQRHKFAESGIDFDFVQDNHSHSVQGTLRGIHYQIRQPQGKLIRVTVGEIFDVAVDIRRGSPTFGKWDSAVINSENFHQVYVPPGYAHGFCVPSDRAQVMFRLKGLLEDVFGLSPTRRSGAHWGKDLTALRKRSESSDRRHASTLA